MERDGQHGCTKKLMENFNSHAHVERDTQEKLLTKYQPISTHTLTWSVTFCNSCGIAENVISTHTLTWSVTFDVLSGLGPYEISTHTLTWSVTLALPYYPPQDRISTHTLTWSVTSGIWSVVEDVGFQLTRSRGA